MNLLEDSWLPFQYRNGEIHYESPLAVLSKDIVDLALPRADFQGAAYQFLIGLLQTAFAPADMDEWIDRFQAPPSAEELGSVLEAFRDSFQLDGEGPLFMQDYEKLASESPISVSSLLIDSPGASTIKNNTDFFVKKGRAETFCPDCSAMALFTMQINAPSGGKGYRTGLRGGGPLTTLVLPAESDSSLWQKLWLNIFDREEQIYPDPDPKSRDLFPWVGPTRTSEKGQKVTSDQVHPLHPLWSMPRRFRLMLEEKACVCDLCGRESDRNVASVKARNYGNNYDGPWRHFLTPYRRDPKKPEEPPLSIKGQPGGLGYRHWESLILEDTEGRGDLPAPVVLDYARKADECQQEGIRLSRKASIWAFGYDLDKMKARCWYSTKLPLLALPAAQQSRLLDWLKLFVGLARETAWQLRKQVKEAWFNRPSDAKGDLEYIEARFWESTEHEFYSLLSQLGDRLLEEQISLLPPDLAAQWYRHVQHQALQVFDELALSGPAEALNMKRITRARNQYMGWFSKNKTPKHFRQQAGLDKEPQPQEAL